MMNILHYSFDNSILHLILLVLILSSSISSVFKKKQHQHHQQQQQGQPRVHQQGPTHELEEHSISSLRHNETILNGTGVIFSATTPDLLNNCLINTLCRHSIPVIVYLPVQSTRTNNFSYIASTLASECPTVVHLSNLQQKHFPHITAKTTHAHMKRAIQTINTTNAEVIYARSFKIKSIRHCPFQNHGLL